MILVGKSQPYLQLKISEVHCQVPAARNVFHLTDDSVTSSPTNVAAAIPCLLLASGASLLLRDAVDCSLQQTQSPVGKIKDPE